MTPEERAVIETAKNQQALHEMNASAEEWLAGCRNTHAAVRALRESCKPKPRFVIKEQFMFNEIIDTMSGATVTMKQIVDALNELHEKAQSK